MSDLTPAAELRAAAEKLRTLATAAPAGPWTRRIHRSRKAGHTVHVELHQPPKQGSNIPEIRKYSPDTGDEVAYTAAMHPGVGLSLADWLDTAAHVHDSMVRGAASVWPDPDEAAERDAWVAQQTDQAALTVARKILGGQS